ncbi:MAG TPA: prenyltransferase/squalene oxidase repeat-containing protein [Bryobacteraceae bacterium]
MATMESVYLRSRRAFLLQTQNSDGGWGYFPGKQSWLEPTTYAMLALHGSTGSEAAWNKALDLVGSWQTPDGGFRPTAAVSTPNWTTAFGVTVSSIGGRNGSAQRGVDYLLQIHGIEGDDRMAKIVSKLLPQVALDRDPSLLAWPWQPNAVSWIEPTAHAVIALRLAAAAKIVRPTLAQRVDLGQRMILSLRCQDGGWNYGSRSALNVALPSYSETTAIAMLGLAGRPESEIKAPLDYARKLAATPQAPLASAWLRVSLALHGISNEQDPNQTVSEYDILLAAVEALGAEGGNAQLLQPGAGERAS